jgi:RNA polymerase sigma factor (sigma-70 family)
MDGSAQDASLVAAMLRGDPDAARMLIARYGPELRAWMSGAIRDAALDDVLQEVWLRVQRSAGRYDPAQPFKQWLNAIATNCFRSEHARQALDKIRHLPIEAAEETPAGASLADGMIERTERDTSLRARIAALPPQQAEVVLLRYYKGLPEKEIAERLGISLFTMRNRLRAALRNLRQSIDRSLYD